MFPRKPIPYRPEVGHPDGCPTGRDLRLACGGFGRGRRLAAEVEDEEDDDPPGHETDDGSGENAEHRVARADTLPDRDRVVDSGKLDGERSLHDVDVALDRGLEGLESVDVLAGDVVLDEHQAAFDLVAVGEADDEVALATGRELGRTVDGDGVADADVEDELVAGLDLGLHRQDEDDGGDANDEKAPALCEVTLPAGHGGFLLVKN